MDSNTTLAHHVFDELIKNGVAEFILCPGSRNAPLVEVLITAPQLTRYSFFDERSAAFFALGRAKALGKPVAVITTSGTAVAELLPGVIEAYYSHIPLCLVTADRPIHFRGRGCPQTIEQLGIFGNYVEKVLDWSTSGLTINWEKKIPLHLNVCFEEPKRSQYSYTPPQRLAPADDEKILAQNLELATKNAAKEVINFLKTIHRPLILLSELPEQFFEGNLRQDFIDYLNQLNAPVYAESLSGFRGETKLHHRLKRGELAFDSIAFDGVLRMGRTPTCRLWRDLEEKQVPVLSLSDLPWTALSYSTCHEVDWPTMIKEFKEMPPCSSRWNSDELGELVELQKHRWLKVKALFDSEPQSEPSLIHRLAQLILPDSQVYLGNSLPIRLWDLGAPWDGHFRFAANRGANGIDGQLSTFLGWIADPARKSSEHSSWALLGDLTSLYDLNAPFVVKQLPCRKFSVVVINNGGGKIFSEKYGNPLFENQHAIEFSHLSRMWGFSYHRWHEIPASFANPNIGNEPSLIEILPDNRATERFWQSYREL